MGKQRMNPVIDPLYAIHQLAPLASESVDLKIDLLLGHWCISVGLGHSRLRVHRAEFL